MKLVTIDGAEIFVGEDEKRIVINDIDETTAKAAWGAICAAYPGFTADFCFRDTLAPIAFLKEIGASEFENCYIMTLSPRDFVDIAPSDADDVRGRTAQIAEAARQAFAANPKENPEMLVVHDDYLEMGAVLHVGFLRTGFYISYRVENI